MDINRRERETAKSTSTAIEHYSITVMASCVGKARLCVLGFWQCLTAELNSANFQRCIMFNKRHVHANMNVMWWCIVLETMILQHLSLYLCLSDYQSNKQPLAKTLDGVAQHFVEYFCWTFCPSNMFLTGIVCVCVLCVYCVSTGCYVKR